MDSEESCCLNICSFLYYYGYYKGNKLRDYLESLICIKLKKKNATFLDLWNFNNHHLKLICKPYGLSYITTKIQALEEHKYQQ